MPDAVKIDFCGEWTTVPQAGEFVIGRDGDLAIDESNQFLHRRFLVITYTGGLWWLTNEGSRLSATVSDPGGSMQAWLAPGARLPLVFDVTQVMFTAGPTTYDFEIYTDTPAFDRLVREGDDEGESTVGPVTLTASQRLLILALAEPMLLRDSTGVGSVPSSAEAAARLGWSRSKFNRKLDNVCDKLDRTGVKGLRGGPGNLASNRRARLVEHAVFSRLVSAEELHLLDEPHDD